MEKFTHEQAVFISLIKTVFGISERTQKGISYLDFHGSNTSQESIAGILGIDSSQFGKMIKPGYTNSLSKHIKRLELFERKERDFLQEKRRQFEAQKREIKLYKSGAFTLLTLLIFSIVYIVALRLKPAEKNYIVDDLIELKRILNYYQSNVNNAIMITAAEINELFRNDTSITDSDPFKNLPRDREMVLSTIRGQRKGLTALGFTNQKGENITKLIDITTPESVMIPFIDSALTNIIYQKEISTSLLKETVTNTSEIVQDDISWRRIQILADSLDFFQ